MSARSWPPAGMAPARAIGRRSSRGFEPAAPPRHWKEPRGQWMIGRFHRPQGRPNGMSDLANKITSQIPIKEPEWLKEFKAFIMRGNVIDLAVGVVIGAAFTAIVTSVVEDLLNPIVGILMGGIDF